MVVQIALTSYPREGANQKVKLCVRSGPTIVLAIKAWCKGQYRSMCVLGAWCDVLQPLSGTGTTVTVVASTHRLRSTCRPRCPRLSPSHQTAPSSFCELGEREPHACMREAMSTKHQVNIIATCHLCFLTCGQIYRRDE